METPRSAGQGPARFAIWMLTAAAIASCGPSVRTVQRGDDPPQPYMQFSVIVDRGIGSLGPAQAEADRLCADVLQSARMYMATDVGDDQTRYFFRCR